MLRRILNILAGLSLAMFVATMILWGRSYWCGDSVSWSSVHGTTTLSQGKSWGAGSSFGNLLLHAEMWITTPVRRGVAMGDHDSLQRWRWRSTRNPQPYARLGFRWEGYWHRQMNDGDVRSTDSHFMLIVPHWSAALLTAILPVWRFGGWKRRRRRYRQAHGLCVNCGYDLRATVDADGPLFERCPECGTVHHAGAEGNAASKEQSG